MLYRVWSVVNRPRGAGAREARRLLFSVRSPSEARTVIRLLRTKREEDPTVLASEYGLEIFTAEGWTEWHDRRGRDVLQGLRASVAECNICDASRNGSPNGHLTGRPQSTLC